MISGCVFSAAVAAVMFVAAKPLLMALQVETVILPEGVFYLCMFFSLSIIIWPVSRAMGDSVSPLIFLGGSAVLNILGDLFFIALLHMGVEGAAISTVICEALSAVLCYFYIQRKVPELRLGKKWLIFDGSMLKKTLAFGFVSALQQSTVQMGKIGTQTIVKYARGKCDGGFQRNEPGG